MKALQLCQTLMYSKTRKPLQRGIQRVSLKFPKLHYMYIVSLKSRLFTKKKVFWLMRVTLYWPKSHHKIILDLQLPVIWGILQPLKNSGSATDYLVLIGHSIIPSKYCVCKQIERSMIFLIFVFTWPIWPTL